MNAKDPKSNIETKSREKYRLWYVYGDLAAHVLNRQRESAYHIGHRSNDGNCDIEAKIKQNKPILGRPQQKRIGFDYNTFFREVGGPDQLPPSSWTGLLAP